MLPNWSILLISLVYLGALFAVARWGDKLAQTRTAGTPRPLIYALSLGVYCTSWTYFGSVGIASRSGLDFIPIYLGPILVFLLGWPLLQMIAGIAKRQNIASIADFVSARYGKSEALGALVTVIAVIGIVPYISIQLKAVARSLEAMISGPGQFPVETFGANGLSIMVAITMGAFAILFGTRHIDTTEHQHGMILAIAVESVVKLVAFVAVGLFVVYGLFGGFTEFAFRASSDPQVAGLFSRGLDGGRWLTMTMLAAFAIILLPRQFHVAVVENASRADIASASRLFPAYLIAINLFVIPIAIAGLLLLPPGSDGDTFVLALPVNAGNPLFAMIAFLGGLSASTAMVIVECIALSIMVCNNLVVPVLLRRHEERSALHLDMGGKLIAIRRWAILVILVMAYFYYRMIGSTAALAQVGLISFAAVAQLAPAFFGGLVWPRATARGAMAGIAAGFAVWAYCLLIPSFADAGWINHSFIDEGPLGFALLKPRQLFNLHFDPLTHGVFWSIIANVTAYIGASLTRIPTAIERVQAASFLAHDLGGGSTGGFRLWRTAVTAAKIEETVSRYVGAERARTAFAGYYAEHGLESPREQEADIGLIKFAEHLLASAVGVSSARLVIALMLERHSSQARGAMRLLDDASAAIQHNRDLLQTAIDNVGQGIAVFDSEQALICWNTQFQSQLGLDSALVRAGAPMAEIMKDFLSHAERGAKQLGERLRLLSVSHQTFREKMREDGRVLEIRSGAIPEGGVVVSFIDVTESVEAAEALERRVEERTSELAAAKAAADAANIGKTRFIASASHDILQPLNAARLFASSLVEKLHNSRDAKLAGHLDQSLEAVEEILNALLDISRLDAGGMKPEYTDFRIGELLETLTLEFAPSARKKGLRLAAAPSSLTVHSDRKLLRRVLQNFISNAIKYTPRGRVLIGCRRKGKSLRIEVHDTGPGIAEDKRALIFEEFHRLDNGDDGTTGLGLGLAIVDRIGRILGSEVNLSSRLGHGSAFSVEVPISARTSAPAQPQRVPMRAGIAGMLTVLVIDNETAILEGMEQLLSGWGCTVHRARNSKEARLALSAHGERIDMILADYHLGREDGISLIGALRKEARRHIPAVLITADRSKKVADKAIAHDAHLLRKPVKPGALRAAMSHVAARAEAAE